MSSVQYLIFCQQEGVLEPRYQKNPSQLVKTIDYMGTDSDINNVNPTTLERLINTPYVRKKIGFTFIKGELRPLKSRKIILENFKTVISTITKGVSVRKLDTFDDRKRWIDQVLDKDQKIVTSSNGKLPPARDRPPSRSRKHLIPSDCKLGINESRINDIFLELKKSLVLSARNPTPNAVAVLFRVFLEASLDKYIAVAKVDLHANSKIKEKIDKVTKDMSQKKIATQNQLLAIRRASSGSKTEISHIQWFHQYVHNSTIQPESDSLKAMWDNMQEFFKILWQFVNSNG